MILVICGLPGVGKSTLAYSLAPLIGATVLSSDKIRKELFPSPTYSQFERKLVYDVMIIIAKYLRDAGVSCILDATFNRENSRSEVRQRLGLGDAEFQIIECVCPEEVARSRLESRKDDYSDATTTVYSNMKKIYEPVRTAHITIDTTRSPDENAAVIAGIISGVQK